MAIRCLIFRGPAHHAQLLRPIEQALREKGVIIHYFTADAEACFQSSLNDELGVEGYHWLPDYVDHDEAQRLYQDHTPYFRRLLGQATPLSLLPTQVVDRIILHTCKEWIAIRRLISKVNPHLCLSLHEMNRWGCIMGAFAHNRKIPYFTLQEGLYYADPRVYTGANRYSTALIWGQGTEDKLLAAGVDPARLIQVGHPDLKDRWQKAEESQGQLWNTLPKEAQGKKLVLAFLGNVRPSEQAGAVLDGLEESEWFVVFRIHQLNSYPHIAIAKKTLTRPGMSYVSVHAGGHLSQVSQFDDFAHHWRLMALAHCFIMIGCSTMAVEWAWSGKPFGQIRTEKMHRDFAQEGIAVDCDGLTMKEAIEKTMTQSDNTKMQAFFRQEIKDDDAASAIADRMIASLQEQGKR